MNDMIDEWSYEITADRHCNFYHGPGQSDHSPKIPFWVRDPDVWARSKLEKMRDRHERIVTVTSRGTLEKE